MWHHGLSHHWFQHYRWISPIHVWDQFVERKFGKISGAKVAEVLEKVSDNPIKGMAAGAGATFMTQSSSITALTLIGFVNAGLMSFRQSVHVMLGSEIGTTITTQLVSFEIGAIFWPLIAIGFFIHMFSNQCFYCS